MQTAEKIVGYTYFFFVTKNTARDKITTVSLNKYSASFKTPTGKMIVLAIKAAKVA